MIKEVIKREVWELVEDNFGVICQDVARFNWIDDIRDTSSYYEVYDDFYQKNGMIGIAAIYIDCLFD